MSQAKKFKELINNTFELSQTVDSVKTVYVSGSDVEFHIKKHFGNVYCYYDNTTDLKADFDQFNRLHIYDFVRLLQALKFDYNPCENFDKYSDITVSHTGTIGTTSNSTMTSKVNAFDSSSLVTDAETVGNGGNTTTLNNSDGTTEHTHGNIGVQTVSNMILQSGTGEAYLRFNNFVEHYLNRWICGCMVAYGDEDNEVEFAQDTEYATKTELETLAQSTSDALNSLTNTVNTQGASITTLDNSLGATISDLREAENDIQSLDGVVNNIGSDVSNHETRIEALESAHGTGIIYSTEERKIGKWIDNSDLYEITIVDTMPNCTQNGVDATKYITIPECHPRSIEARFLASNDLTFQQLPIISSGFATVGGNTVVMRGTVGIANGIQIQVNLNMTIYANRTLYITLRYTK